MEAPDFWDDAEKASADMKELKDLKSIVERADALSMAYDDIMTLIEMGNEEADESLVPEVENEFVQFQKEFEDLRITTSLPVSMMPRMRFLPCMQEPVAQRVAIGQVCCAVCMRNGQTNAALA